MTSQASPEFLTVEQVESLHARTIRVHGGMPGMRDRALLESAVAMPMQSVDGSFLHPDIPAMASAYLFHIVRNHPFQDGNKRAGALAALVFLHLNGWRVDATTDELEQLILGVASSCVQKHEVERFIRDHARQSLTGP